jgi:hypothetical protein
VRASLVFMERKVAIQSRSGEKTSQKFTPKVKTVNVSLQEWNIKGN